MTASPQGYLQGLSRWHPIEIAFWLCAAATIFVFPNRYLILTEGHLGPHTSKTANSAIRYLPDRVVGLDGVRAEIAMLQTPDGHGRAQ